MFGQAHLRLVRLCGIVAAAFFVLVLPAIGQRSPAGSVATLRLENAELASKSHSAVLDLYSLDAGLATARSHLATDRRDLRTLRRERTTLARELRLAHTGELISERQLASRLRQLYEQGDVSPLEVVFGASSITDAMIQLDNVHRVASLNDEVLNQLHTAQSRLLTTSQQLVARTADLQAAARAAAANEASLTQARAARAAYVSSLASRRNLNSAEISSLELQARAAQSKAQRVTRSLPVTPDTQRVSFTPQAAAGASPGARTLSVTVSGYALPGRTATGIPVGWGVAAVDPSVIPLGSHIWIPGYGEAVAADVGGSIVGTRVDIWFPTVGQAQAWGLQTVTITLP